MNFKVAITIVLGWGLFLWSMYQVSPILGNAVAGLSLLLIGIAQIDVKKGDST
jgi:hypothetical protein